jgi:signal transduction histidine kinase
MARALHELQVHQIELEMQNEQLRATQAELEIAREQYADLYEFAPVGYMTLSEGGLILAANLTSSTMLRVERSALLSVPFSRFVVPQDQDAYYFCWRRVLSAPRKEVCEVRLRPAGFPVFDARLEVVQALQGGKIVCRLTLSDITEQKRAAQALHESKRRRLQYENDQRLRLALAAGDLGTWDHDLTTGQITCSERARAMLEIPLGSPVTWPSFLALLHSEHREDYERAIQDSAEPGGPGRLDAIFRIVVPSGAVRWLRFVAQCFFAPGPPRIAVRRTGLLADITRQKEAEQLLACRAKQLESLVAERTARLEEAVAELDHFSYTLAHDLRAPLRAIRGWDELLLSAEPGLSPEHRLFLARSCAAAHRMDELIVDALNYNKLVSQQFPLGPVDCGPLLQQLLDSYPQFQEARSSIAVSSIPPVIGNPSLLTQCFSNLLNNALKFVALGQVPNVRVLAEDRGSRVRIWIEDNGIGIAQEYHEKVFEMFERINDQYEGTGIGLALVRKAVQRMQGSVGVASELGQGSRFWIELNKAEVAMPSPQPPHTPS